MPSSGRVISRVSQDVDGVLNAYITGTPELDPRLLHNLKRTLSQTDAASQPLQSRGRGMQEAYASTCKQYMHVCITVRS